MISWIKQKLDKLASLLDSNPNDPHVEAEMRRIYQLTVDQAHDEFWSRVDQSQVAYELSDHEFDLDGYDLPPGVRELFAKYKFIECGFEDPRIDRELVTPLPENPNFIKIGTTTDVDEVYIWRGLEGVFKFSIGESSSINKDSPLFKSIYHCLLNSMITYE